MLHFSCDLCGQQLKDDRYVARIDVYPAFDPDEITEDDLDVDNMQQVAQMIEHMEATGENLIEDCEPRKMRFDLCPGCRKRFLKDPLGGSRSRLNFSEN